MNMSFILLNGDAATATGSDGHSLISYYVTLIVIFVVFYLILTYPKVLKEASVTVPFFRTYPIIRNPESCTVPSSFT